MEDFSGNRTGTGGLVTFADSGWLLSIVMFHQPHFRGQPAERPVFWGYGLRGDRPGDVVRKPMAQATGGGDPRRTRRPASAEPASAPAFSTGAGHPLPHALHHQPVHAAPHGRPRRR